MFFRSIRNFILYSVICGVIYPLLVTGFGTLLFTYQSTGSLLKKGGIPVGSELIGQNFSAARYFRGRPSATFPGPYNALASSGSNMALSNPAFLSVAAERARLFSDLTGPVPVELVTSSASGLDPEISLGAALFQIPLVAKARNIPEDKVKDLVHKQVKSGLLGIWGVPRLNVLTLNMALDNSSFD